MRNRRILLILLVVLLSVSGCKVWWPWGRTSDIGRATADVLYQRGLEEYKAGSYKRSAEVFQRLKEEYPLSPLALMAEIGIGDSYFSAKEYPDAALAYADFLQLHPTNENLPYVMYQLGMSYYHQAPTVDRDQTETERALKEFERLTARFPDSKFAAMGQEMIRKCKRNLADKEFYIGEFYYRIGEYRAALKRFDRISAEYGGVGLDEKVRQLAGETKRRLALLEAKQGPAGKR